MPEQMPDMMWPLEGRVSVEVEDAVVEVNSLGDLCPALRREANKAMRRHLQRGPNSGGQPAAPSHLAPEPIPPLAGGNIPVSSFGTLLT